MFSLCIFFFFFFCYLYLNVISSPQQTWSLPNNNSVQLYETLLPSLAGKPLSTILSENADPSFGLVAPTWRYLPLSGDASLVHCLLEALCLVLTRKGLSPNHCQYATVLFKWQVCLSLWREVEGTNAQTFKYNEWRDLQYAFQNMSTFVAQTLSPVANSLFSSAQAQHMLQGLEGMSNYVNEQLANYSKRHVPLVNSKPMEYFGYPLFQSFMRDESVEVIIYI